MFTNWIVNYGITRATPNMITNMGWGVFLMYAILTYVGVAFIWLCMPETKVCTIKPRECKEKTDWTPHRDVPSSPWTICSNTRFG